MRRTPVAAPALLVAIVLALAANVAPAGPAAEAPPTPTVRAATERDVVRISEDASTALSAKNDETFARALEQMESLRHESFVPHIRKGLGSAEPSVLSHAIRAAATHELRDVEKDIRKLLHPKAKKDLATLPGAVSAAAIDYMARLSFAGEEGIVLDDLFIPLLADEQRMKASSGVELARASIDYLGKNKYRRAVKQFVAMIPLPKPKKVDDTKNPPVSFWEARVKLWQASDGWVRWALKEITGQELAGATEWDAWLKLHGKDYR